MHFSISITMRRGLFWAGFFLNLAALVFAWLYDGGVFNPGLMGVKFGVLSALVVEAMTKLVNVVGTINPGNFGTFEGGTMLIGKMFGLTGATGLALGLASRLQAFFWAAAGGICLFICDQVKNGREMPKARNSQWTSREKIRMARPKLFRASWQAASSLSPFF